MATTPSFRVKKVLGKKIGWGQRGFWTVFSSQGGCVLRGGMCAVRGGACCEGGMFAVRGTLADRGNVCCEGEASYTNTKC